MKKLFAVLLALALLLPMGLGTVANAEEVEKKGFYVVNWSAPLEEKTNIYTSPYFWSNSSKVAAGEAHVSMPHVSGTGGTIEGMAAALKEIFDSYPEGARYFTFCLVHDAMHQHAEICFFDKAVPLVTGWLDQFLAEYKRIGGKLDGISIDVEFLNIYCSYLYDNVVTKDPLTYKKIVEHPTYQSRIRPQLVERGFKFYPNVTDETPEIYGIYPQSGAQYAVSRGIWNTVMRNYLGEVVGECCAPLWKYYPDASVNDYQTKDVNAWNKELDDSGSIRTSGGNSTTAGNCGNDNFYFVRPRSNYFTSASTKGPSYAKPVSYIGAYMEEKPFNRFLFDMNVAGNTALSSRNGRYTWVIAHHLYEPSANSPYTAETNYHLGLLNPEMFLGYILEQDCKKDPDLYELALTVVDQTMQELDRVAGYADRKTIYIDPTLNHNFVLTGMYANGRNIYRLTPDMAMGSLEDFKVAGASDLTFRIGGETITFPGGKIIEDSKIDEIGTFGFWIETAKDVTPTITRDSDYFRNNPTIGEDYEGYEANTRYAYDNANPEGCWEMKKGTDTNGATIVASANGKELAFKGTYTVKNVTMPGKVTAGDAYANNQAWEVSVTLPTDLAADAEVILLNAANEKKKSSDGGIKIAGGKVFYTKEGEYAEWEGVTLNPGTKYTIIRDLDFNDPENFTSDFYIYTADGTEVAKIKDVPMEELVLPVYSISLGTVKVAGEPVLVDDYKLYPTKVTAGMELYNASTGMKYAETDKAVSGDTVYRLSWLNATNQEKSYTVMAAYYNGETLVEEKAIQDVKLAPNGDGVIIGTVENKVEGQTLKVYLKDNNPAETDEPAGGENTTEDPNKGADGKGNLIIIIAAAAAVVVVVALVVVILISKKKKTAKTDAE